MLLRTHTFNHTNIAGPTISSWDRGYRGFDSVVEMNDTIIHNINSVVGPDDVLWHLGDFAFGDKTQIPALRERINCRTIHLTYGNHDHALKKSYRHCFSSCQNYAEVRHNKKRFVFMHYPLHVWDGHQHGAIHLFGHQHGNGNVSTRKREDVGIDCYPVPQTLDFFIELMEGRN